jgi:hypothetical protein
MNRYDPRTPRALFGFAAIALTAATLALSVSVPARIEHAPPAVDLSTRVANERYVPDGGSVVTSIDVVAVRGSRTASIAQSPGAHPILVRS